jgi:hypothetical protein
LPGSPTAFSFQHDLAGAVVNASEKAILARKVARLAPVACTNGQAPLTQVNVPGRRSR